MYEYNPERIRNAIKARRRISRICKLAAKESCPYSLPDSVINRVYSRRNLYNFLENLELSTDKIREIFHAYDLAVPRDHTPIYRKEPIDRNRPEWIKNLNRDLEHDLF